MVERSKETFDWTLHTYRDTAQSMLMVASLRVLEEDHWKPWKEEVRIPFSHLHVAVHHRLEGGLGEQGLASLSPTERFREGDFRQQGSAAQHACVSGNLVTFRTEPRAKI